MTNIINLHNYLPPVIYSNLYNSLKITNTKNDNTYADRVLKGDYFSIEDIEYFLFTFIPDLEKRNEEWLDIYSGSERQKYEDLKIALRHIKQKLTFAYDVNKRLKD